MKWTRQQREAFEQTAFCKVRDRCPLSEMRVELGLTNHDFAARCGISPSDLSALETGTRSPTSRAGWRPQAERVAAYLGVTCAVLWPDHEPKVTPDAMELPSTPEECYLARELFMEVWRALEKLEPIQQAILMLRFGLNGDEVGREEMSEAELARKLKVSRTRMGKMEQAALGAVLRELKERGVMA